MFTFIYLFTIFEITFFIFRLKKISFRFFIIFNFLLLGFLIFMDVMCKK